MVGRLPRLRTQNRPSHTNTKAKFLGNFQRTEMKTLPREVRGLAWSEASVNSSYPFVVLVLSVVVCRGAYAEACVRILSNYQSFVRRNRLCSAADYAESAVRYGLVCGIERK